MGDPRFGPNKTSLTALIDISESTTISTPLQIGDYKLAGIQFGTMTGTAMTFQASSTVDGTYVPVYDSDGNAISITIASDTYVGITGASAAALAAVKFLKLVSGTAELADRTPILFLAQ